MAASTLLAYKFGQFTLVPAEKRLTSGGNAVPLAPKVFDTLLFLVENQGRLIEKEEFFKAVWPRNVVEEVGLAHNVSQLRKALGDSTTEPKFIETVPKRGYRFIAAVQQVIAGQEAPLAAQVDAPSIRGRKSQPRPAVLAVLVIGLLSLAAATVHFFRSPTTPRVADMPPAIGSLMVLPFENLSGDKGQEYFSDGMTDELITDLGTMGAFRVASRTSTMQFKGTRKPLKDIARELQVDAVLEGTVLRSGNRVRITAQLIGARNDAQLWAQSYERDLNDVLLLQADVSRDIAEAIRIKLTPQQRTALSAAHAVNPEAHDAYLRGRYFLSSVTGEPFGSRRNVKKALECFQEAAAKDANYAAAYAGLADAFMILSNESETVFKERMANSRTAALKAVELDPSLAEAHTALAGTRIIDWDWSGAEMEFKAALALNSNYAYAHIGYGFVLTAMGKLDDALREMLRAREIDPTDFGSNQAAAEAYYTARKYDDALRESRRGLEMYPDQGIWNWMMGEVYEQKKMYNQAYEQFHQSIVLNKEADRALAIEKAYKEGGYRGAVLQMIRFWDEPPRYGGSGDGYLAHHYAMLNDQANAMRYLERRFNNHEGGLAGQLSDPAFDSLRSLPEFRDLIRRMGLPASASQGAAKSLTEHRLVGAIR